MKSCNEDCYGYQTSNLWGYGKLYGMSAIASFRIPHEIQMTLEIPKLSNNHSLLLYKNENHEIH